MLDEDQSINHNMSSSYSSTEAKVYAISDIHSDHPANDKWLEALPESEYLHDVLIVAGDVSDKMDVLDKTLTTLRSKFGQVPCRPECLQPWEFYDILNHTRSCMSLVTMIYGFEEAAKKLMI